MNCCKGTYGAARNGHLDCLKYAHENGYPWYEATTYWAARNGHLDCLQYAHENGCPWKVVSTYAAAAYGHLDCLEYIFEIVGCEVAPWDKRLNDDSFSKKILEYIEKVREDWVNKRNVPGKNIKG